MDECSVLGLFVDPGPLLLSRMNITSKSYGCGSTGRAWFGIDQVQGLVTSTPGCRGTYLSSQHVGSRSRSEFQASLG